MDKSSLSNLLKLQREPIAIRFQDSAPSDLPRIENRAASGCSYWRLASEGQAFYTEASDHYGCPIGAHTHAVEMPEETAAELNGLIGTMVELQYLSMDEVPQIPTRDQPMQYALYAPLSSATFTPDVVMATGNAKQMMMLAEAAHSAGIECDASVVGRPTCAAIPAVMKSGKTAANLGCIGNRVYTQLDDDSMYFVLSGDQLETVLAKLETLVNANNKLEVFHNDRAAAV